MAHIRDNPSFLMDSEMMPKEAAFSLRVTGRDRRLGEGVTDRYRA